MSRRLSVFFIVGLVLLAMPLAVAQQRDDSAPGRRRGRGPGRRGGFGRGRMAQPDDTAGFVAIFDGRSLDNWDGDPRFWRVEDGAIVGQTTPDNPLETNTFLIWQGGKTADFELKLEYKITASGNSGVQYRSEVLPDVGQWAMRGYQADMDGGNRFTGMIYEERGRGFLAPRGQFSRKADDGTTKVIGSVGESGALGELIKAEDWNQLHVIARGPTLLQFINGHIMSGLVDEDEEGRSTEGLLGLQLHVGQPMQIQFRNIYFKDLAAADAESATVGDNRDPRAAVMAATEELAGATSYRWETRNDTAAGGGFRGGPGGGAVQGEVDANGFVRVSPQSGGGLHFVTKDDQAAVLVEGNWQTVPQAIERSGGQGRGRGRGRGGIDPSGIAEFKLPPAVAEEYLALATNLQRDGDTITGTLSDDSVNTLLAGGPGGRGGFGGRRGGRGGGPPSINNPEGSVTFRITDGVLTEFSLALAGSREFRGREFRLDRTTTTTISDVGATTVDVPPDAREIVEALIAGRTPNVFVPEPGFTRLFNGRDLTGWAGRPGHWSVEDGAIVGRTTRENPARGNNFLIAKDGDENLIVDDFELRLSYRITPNNDSGFANSGIQYRSKERDNFVAAGYQADFEAGTTYSGILYDEAGGAGGRGIMAERGEIVTWTPEGEREVTGSLGSSDEIQAAIKQNDWNEYTIIARGNHLQHFINGVQTVDVIDDDASNRLESGILALQLHAGEPMTVSFKDIRIKSLSGAENQAAGNMTVAEDFKLEQLYVVPRETEGSWVASCLDDKGRMIVSDQNGRLYRLTLPPTGRIGRIQPEPIDLDIGGAHGLLYAFDSLYVMVNEGRRTHGLYRVRDTNGDDQFDEVELLRAIDGGGEHGLHAVLLAPDGESLYVVCGDQTRMLETDSSRVPLFWSEDHLLPRLTTGFMAGVLGPGGFIARTDPDGESWELIAVGFRNEFDAAFNREGELFTFDADMEWDIGDPWYRPTRVNHVISGAEFGWRNGAGKWPDYYFDSFGAVVNIGPGSPTGVTFGYGAKFPAKYQEAFYIADWSFGKLYAVHLTPEGASYTGEVEEFITGQPFPITDVIINPHDGAMYITVGGRGTQSALYRVSYTGSESTAPSTSNADHLAERDLRRHLETFHGHQDPQAIAEVWPYLGHDDRAIRHAARIALEWQNPDEWRSRALDETDARTAIAALAALARATSRDEFHRRPTDPEPDPALKAQLLAALDRIDWAGLDQRDQVDFLRALSLAFIRLGPPDDDARRAWIAKLDPHVPAQTRELNSLLVNLLVYLDSPTVAEKAVALLQNAPTQEEQIEYALALRVQKSGWTMPLNEAYFRWFVEPAGSYRGGNTFASSLRSIKEQAVAALTDDQRDALADVLNATPVRTSPADLLAARQFVKEWTVDELVPLIEEGLDEDRDLERGRQLYAAVACASCHRFAQEGGSAGPDLTGIAGRFSLHDFAEAVVEPSKVISDQYRAITIMTNSGRTVTGRIANLSGNGVSVVEDMLAPGDMTRVDRSDIESMEPSEVSVMPAGLLNTLTEDEIQDLVGYLYSPRRN